MSNNLLNELVGILDQFSWRDWPWKAIEKTSTTLRVVNVKLDDVVGLFQGLTEEQIDNLAHQSYETPTHFKWFLFRSKTQGFEIWVHQFKDEGSKSGVFADSIHNHRYHFISAVVSGGYRQVMYHFTGHHCAPTFETRNLQVASIRDFSVGELNALDYRTYHSLMDIKPNTVALYVRTPALVEESTVLFPGKDGKGMIKHFPPLTVYLRNWLKAEQKRLA